MSDGDESPNLIITCGEYVWGCLGRVLAGRWCDWERGGTCTLRITLDSIGFSFSTSSNSELVPPTYNKNYGNNKKVISVVV